MAKDHYIPQTYLKHFGDPSKDGMLNTYRKSDGKQFSCWPKAVCYEPGGDLNPRWLRNPTLLAEERQRVEPSWNPAVKALLSSSLPNEHRLSIAGFVAQLLSCTPTWKRVGTGLLNASAAARLVDSGTTTEPPDYDPDYTKADATTQLQELTWYMYNHDWVVLRNETSYPFITSDNPVAILPVLNVNMSATRFLPITPTACLATYATQRKKNMQPFNPALPMGGRLIRRNVSAKEAMVINRIQARCAEDLIFSSVEDVGIAKLSRNAARYSMVNERIIVPTDVPGLSTEGSIIRIKKSS